MKYFRYELPRSNWHLIGTEKSQIISTISYYNYERGKTTEVPSESDISEIGDIEITCMLAGENVYQFFEARVRDTVLFRVYANAFDHVQQIARTYEELKRGDLFKFDTGLDKIFGLYFLPEDIMQGLREYDWGQHRDQIDGWLRKKEAEQHS